MPFARFDRGHRPGARPRLLSRAPAWLTSRPIAHRGLHGGGVPENSLAAFEAAASAGVPLELDVHASSDGEPVVFHDETLARMTGCAEAVADLPWHRLRALRLAGTSERIPHLHQVFECVRGRVPVVVEIKNKGAAGTVERAAARVLAGVRGPVAVQSFNPMSLRWFQRQQPALVRGMLSGELGQVRLSAPRRFALEWLLAAPWVRPDYVGYALNALPHRAPTLLRRAGVPLLAWTVRTPDGQARARALADNYIYEGVDPSSPAANRFDSTR